MKINVTDARIALEEGEEIFPLLEKPKLPDYSNVTARPHFSYYYTKEETVWERLCFCMEKLPALCPDDPYLGCYALMFSQLYTLLLSTNQAKNIIAYGPPTDCGAYRAFQDFMTFLQEGSSLTALAQSPFSFTALTKNFCHALLYRLDTCPAPAAVCDAVERVKTGGLILLYTVHNTLPAELGFLSEKAEKNCFGSCTVYTLIMDESLFAFALANSSEAFILSLAEELERRTNDLQGLIQAMLSDAALSEDTYFVTTLILQQTEEILLSIYDYLENAALPILTNALKEAVLNYFVGIRSHFDLITYRERLVQSSKHFFSSMEEEFL